MEAQKEFRNTVATAMLKQGETEKRPFKVYVPIPGRSISETLLTLKAAAAMVSNFAHSTTTFETLNPDPATKAILHLYPFSAQIRSHEHPKNLPSAGLFWPGGADRYNPAQPVWQDFFLTPSLIGPSYFWGMPDCPLRVPRQMLEQLTKALLGEGVTQDGWFVCMDTGLGDPSAKPYPPDDSAYLALRDHIIDTLGGQVVKIGYASKPRWPERSGFVDLSATSHPLLIHALAVSHARAFVGARSLGSALAHAFSIPSARTDCLEPFGGRKDDLVLTPAITMQDGKPRMQGALLDHGIASAEDLEKEHQAGHLKGLRANSAEELLVAAQQILSETEDIPMWRTPPKPFIKHQGYVDWPPHSDAKPRYTALPDART